MPSGKKHYILSSSSAQEGCEEKTTDNELFMQHACVFQVTDPFPNVSFYLLVCLIQGHKRNRKYGNVEICLKASDIIIILYMHVRALKFAQKSHLNFVY